MRSSFVSVSFITFVVACGGEPFQTPTPTNMVAATTSSSTDSSVGGGGAGGETVATTTGTPSSDTSSSTTTKTTSTTTTGTPSSGTSTSTTTTVETTSGTASTTGNEGGGGATTTSTGEGAGGQGGGGGNVGGGGSGGSGGGVTTTTTTETTSTTSSSTTLSCLQGTKLCGGWCVLNVDPGFGCGVEGCAPCNVPHATPTCAGTECAVASCDSGYGNCNDIAADGCETDLAASSTNCGVCGKVCGQLEQCVAAVCIPTSCPAGLGNCDGNQANGCEADLKQDVGHCGSCGNACKLAHATPTCSASECAIASCDQGFDDCDGLAANGCELTVTSDVKNCGGCGTVCSFANAATSCGAGVCKLGACNALWGNCDNGAANGCEKPLAADTANCGACGKSCGAQGNTCESGKCYIPCGSLKIPVGKPAVCFSINSNKQPPGTQPAVGGIIPPNGVTIPWDGCTSPGTGNVFGCSLGEVVGQPQIKATIKAIQGATKYSMCGPWGAGSAPLCNVDTFIAYNGDGTVANKCTGTGLGDGAGLPFCAYASEGGEVFILATVK